MINTSQVLISFLVQTFLVAISQKLQPYNLFGLLCFMHSSWLIDSGTDFIFFLCCLIVFLLQDRRIKVQMTFCISLDLSLTWLEGLCRACRQLNVCIWTARWIHEFCVFLRWQHQDRQHYQIASWNINHFEISDFKAQLQLSEQLSNTNPVSGRSVVRKGCFPNADIYSSHMQVGLGKEKRN